MTIENTNDLLNAMLNNFSRFNITKNNPNLKIGEFFSLWRISGLPSIAPIPTTPVVYNASSVGGIGYTQVTSPTRSYLGIAEYYTTTGGIGLFLYDRLMARGGLVGNITTSQTVGVDLSTNLGTSNLLARIGQTDYTQVHWFVEVYTALGATATTMTVNVTYSDGTTGNIAVPYTTGAAVTGTSVFINPFTPSNKNGLGIRAVNTIQFAASTGVAGNFGVTAAVRKDYTQMLSTLYQTKTWVRNGLVEIANNSCIVLMAYSGVASTVGVVRITGKIIHG